MTLSPSTVTTLAAMALVLTGCSVLSPKKDPTRFYELTQVTHRPEAALQSKGALILSVTVAGYLQNASLVRRIAPNEISYFPFDQWAQPLGEGVTQVLRSDLTVAMGVPVLSATESYVTRDAARVEIQVRRLDILPEQRVQVAATWQVRTSLGGDQVKQGEFNRERAYSSDPTSLQGAVAVLSDLLGELSQAVVADLPNY